MKCKEKIVHIFAMYFISFYNFNILSKRRIIGKNFACLQNLYTFLDSHLKWI